MRLKGARPSPVLATALLWVLLLNVQFPDWDLLRPGVSLVLISAVTWQLTRHKGNPIVDWALTLTGPLYVGWFGAHLISLRNLPGGLWWTVTTLASIWAADGAAYLVGRAWGRHKLAPRVSPGKTWEGWVSGIIVSAPTTAGLAALWGLAAGPEGPTPLEGLLSGLVIASAAPLGDLFVSKIKRLVGVKDTGVIFPGHGGALDRIDSLLWAVVIGYYFAVWFHGL